MLLKSNQIILLKNGKNSIPFPKINKLTKKSQEKIDSWLIESVLSLNLSEYSTDLIKNMKSRKISPADRSFLNSILFDI